MWIIINLIILQTFEREKKNERTKDIEMATSDEIQTVYDRRFKSKSCLTWGIIKKQDKSWLKKFYLKIGLRIKVSYELK